MKKLRVTLNGKTYEVDVEILKDEGMSSMPYIPTSLPPLQQVNTPSPVTATAQKKSPADGNVLVAPMNGLVIEIPVKVGDDVKAGQVVVILEAMKMKTNISAEHDGKIASINVSQNDSVESGQIMLTFA